MASPVASPAGSLTAVTPSELARPAAEGGRSLARTAVTPSELARPAAEGRRLCGVCGGYAERAGEAGGRGEALDAARARLRALVAEGGVAGRGRAPPI